MLKWIFERLEGEADAQSTPDRAVPARGRAGRRGPGPDQRRSCEILTSVDREVWREEASHIPPFYERFGERLPAALWDEYEALLAPAR